MESKTNLKKILEELSFTEEESNAFIESIQIVKDSQKDSSINCVQKIQLLVNGVVENDI